ncbi:hypothetical protein [Roseibacillus ishigakijimensis]|uniref:Uncharacterized protein n=1 Tax=Roseibacillus ishigakijimensis TaxID=454146 RepID=A0A934VLJ9_9BACT|nr:hypothetical protein [Roseibacillus ishigakijimensis]MBK1832970.1 hypothetical protein [Roseibacillus ishigakijimensis]
MKNTLKFALVSALLVGAPAAFAAESAQSCKDIQSVVEKAVKADAAKVLEVVEAQVSANSGCACEVVKAAIVATEADKDLVRSIVEVAVVAAPGEMRLIAQCAVAVAPDSVTEVQQVLASFDAQSGESVMSSGSKGGLSKGGLAKGDPVPLPGVENPLDGPLVPGGPGGDPWLPELPPFQPPTITPEGASPTE